MEEERERKHNGAQKVEKVSLRERKREREREMTMGSGNEGRD